MADLRAPTPSAAAELAVYDYRQLFERIEDYQRRLNRQMEQKLLIYQMRLKEYQTKLNYLHPRYKLQEQEQRLMELEDKMRELMENKIKSTRHRLELYIERMKGLSPILKLNSGYSYVEDMNGKALKSVSQVQNGEVLKIHVTDGTVYTEVCDKKEEQHG